MANELIDINVLIDHAWVDFARQAIVDYDLKYRYYIHASSEPIEIGGALTDGKLFIPLNCCLAMKNFLFRLLIDYNLIDLDFERTWDHFAAVSRYFLDSKIDVGGDPLGIVTTNSDQNILWFEILLDGERLIDHTHYRRYASLHEYGHTLGLEHPFNNLDGDKR